MRNPNGIVKDGIYYHNPDMAYPAVDTQHIVESDKKHTFVYDKDFMYRLHGFPHNIKRVLFKVAMVVLAQPVCAVRYALRIKGRENIRKYRAVAGSRAMISVCNHTTEWDSLFVSMTRYFRFAEFPIWQEGAESSAGMMYRVAGGIVMPKDSVRGKLYAYRCMEDVVREGKWLHVFPEAACWPFYPAVREFQPGTFRLAVAHRMPILPMAVKYRPNRGIYKLFKKHPNATIIIGEPLMPDLSLPKDRAIDDLCHRSRMAVMDLLGIDSEERNTEIRQSFATY